MLNDVNLIGNLGVDPEGKAVGTDNYVCKFSLATSRKQKHPSGNWQEVTQWHRIVVWGKQAENCAKYLQKGSKIYLSGEIVYGHYEKEGQKIYTTDIVARDIKFLSNTKTGEEQTQNSAPKKTEDVSSEDIPF